VIRRGLILALAACAGPPDEVEIRLRALGAPAECLHARAVRVDDGALAEYLGRVEDAELVARPGAYRLGAVGWRAPCDAVPRAPPWVAGEQTVELLGRGEVALKLDDARVKVGATFVDDGEPRLVPRARSVVRLGRDGADASGPRHALDGWEVKQLTLPSIGKPGKSKETVTFSVEGKGPPSPPRGLAVLPDGRFVVQTGDPRAPLWVFTPTGALAETWSVVVPAGTPVSGETAGLDAIDAFRLVRTGDAGLEVLHRSGTTLTVGEQIPLAEPPLAVAHLAGTFAVASRAGLARVDAAGVPLAGPVAVDGEVRGLIGGADGRLFALDVRGRMTSWDADDLDARPRESKSFPVGLDLPRAASLAWNPAAARWLVLSSLAPYRLVSASEPFDAIAESGIDLAAHVAPSSIAVAGGEVAVLDGDQVAFYDLATRARVRTVTLPAAAVSLAIAGGELMTVTGRDAVVAVHALDGTPLRTFELAAVARARSVRARGDELLVVATDRGGIDRLLVTGLDGTPRRSVRLDGLGGPVVDVAPLGADLGVLIAWPGRYLRALAPP
jgi:hypothetical protein